MFTGAIIISLITMGGLGIIFAVFLVIAQKKFHVDEEPLVEKLLAILPGTNCGACGFAGCHTLAEKIAHREAPINSCPSGGQALADAIAEAVGVEPVKVERLLAVVICRGGEKEALKNSAYRGDRTCASANISGGEKACAWSCFGYGDCVMACKFDSMAMNDNGLPVVFHDKCVGCAACAKACPRDIIEMHHEARKLFVYCRNKDRGAAAKKVCTAACISCGLCVKDCPVEGGITLVENLAVINYDLCPQTDAPIKRCPTKCILFAQEELATSERFYKTRFGQPRATPTHPSRMGARA